MSHDEVVVQGCPEHLWRYQDLWCMAVGYYHGSRCGYVLIPKDHPWHGLGIHDPVPNPKSTDDLSSTEDRIPIIPLFAESMKEEPSWDGLEFQASAHGGVTFASDVDYWNEILEDHDGIPNGWWIGFDAGHAGDSKDLNLMKDPKVRAMWEDIFGKLPFMQDMHVWTTPDIVREVEYLADQVVAAKVEASGERQDGSPG